MPQNMPYTEKISQQSTKSTAFNTRKSELGNNIHQYSDNGVNSQRDTWYIQYAVMTEAEMNTATSVFDSVGAGWDYLVWRPYGEPADKKWILTESGYSITPLSGDKYQISVTLEQEH